MWLSSSGNCIVIVILIQGGENQTIQEKKMKTNTETEKLSQKKSTEKERKKEKQDTQVTDNLNEKP